MDLFGFLRQEGIEKMFVFLPTQEFAEDLAHEKAQSGSAAMEDFLAKGLAQRVSEVKRPEDVRMPVVIFEGFGENGEEDAFKEDDEERVEDVVLRRGLLQIGNKFSVENSSIDKRTGYIKIGFLRKGPICAYPLE